MTASSSVIADDLHLEGASSLWELMRVALRVKEENPRVRLLPTVLVLKSQAIVAKLCRSEKEPHVLLVHTGTGIRKISLVNCDDAIRMLYRTTLLMLEKVEGSAVVLLGERADLGIGHAAVCAMKWTARQFLQPAPAGATFPETNDSIAQPFDVEDEKVCWMPEVNTALQFAW
jgi:hypothetical protein